MAASYTQSNSREFEKQILQGVSRSFALTIPQLPRALRGVVTTAYLLCRIVDTIEDEEELSIEQKRHYFQLFVELVQGRAAPEQFAAGLHPLLGPRTLDAEKELVQNSAMVIQSYFSYSPEQQAALKRCVEIMAKGMLSFQELKNPHGLATMIQMNNYCYHVAGVVGEMLTELFCHYSERIAANREQLFKLAACFGQGLQMTNILKDIWEDKKRGACWLPREVFDAVGFDLKEMSPDEPQPAFGKGLGRLVAIAHHHLRDALAYTLLIPSNESGIRRFCLWAVGMAVYTLDNIYHNLDFKRSDEIKISRTTVKRVILASNATLFSDGLVKLLFNLAARNLPKLDPRDELWQAYSILKEKDLPLKT
jgi:farnesyl-diphosphate farnesyltransferase